ncbi:DNA pilot protein [Dipodfec virus UOA04_Rod_997]|nr:DNA pilot protein [Dipodfec virus UOA04_Rod_997]
MDPLTLSAVFGNIAGGVSQVGNIFSSIGNNRTARKNAKLAAKTSMDITNLNNEAQMRLAKYQNDYNMQMWNKENEYNSPKAQMARLDEAGLNKALMYSQGSTGNASSPAPAATPNIDYSGIKPAYHVSRMAAAGDALKNMIGIAEAVEEYKKTRLENKSRAIDLENQSDYWNLRMLNGWNNFYWKGGVPDASLSGNIQKALYERMRGQADFQIGNANFFKHRINLMDATKSHLSTMDRLINQTIYEFDKTTRPWIESLGRWYKPAAGAATGLGKIAPWLLFK